MSLAPEVLATADPEVLRIRPRLIEDGRGFFFESWNAQTFSQGGLEARFVQDNHSRSTAGCLRGLHYQIDRAQGKLVRAAVGEIYDVAVDLRRSSSSFGQWVGATLSATNREMLWVPPGFAHGFYVVSEEAEVLYKCTDFYSPGAERTVIWNDPDLAIDWPRDAEPAAEGLCQGCRWRPVPGRGVLPLKVLRTGADGQLGCEILRTAPATFELTGCRLSRSRHHRSSEAVDRRSPSSSRN